MDLTIIHQLFVCVCVLFESVSFWTFKSSLYGSLFTFLFGSCIQTQDSFGKVSNIYLSRSISFQVKTNTTENWKRKNWCEIGKQ